MNTEDIIRMAGEAGFLTRGVQQYVFPPTSLHITYELERFAALVAAAEREACAKLIPPQYFEFRDAIRARGETK